MTPGQAPHAASASWPTDRSLGCAARARRARRARARSARPRRSAPSGCCSTRSPGGGCCRADRAGSAAAPPAPRRGTAAVARTSSRGAAGSTAAVRDDRRQDRAARAAPSPTDAPARVNLLIPTIDLEHFFGGYIAKFNLARRLAERGVRVRIVTVDPVGPLPRGWKRSIEALQRPRRDCSTTSRSRSVASSSALEVSASDASSRRPGGPPTSPRAALESVDADRFVYLIQEYEPFTFPMGTYAALAARLLRLAALRAVLERAAARLLPRPPDRRLRERRSRPGRPRSASFQNAISDVHPPAAAELSSARRAQAAVLRAAGAARRAQHVRARGARARPRARRRARSMRAGELDGIGAVRAAPALSAGRRGSG